MDEITAEFTLGLKDEIDAEFNINLTPSKLSELENDINLVSREEVQEGLDTKQPVGDYATNSSLTKGLNTKADKATTLKGYNINDAYTKEEIDAKLTSLYRFKGTVANYESLPTANLVVGDVYNVEETGANYAWDGTTWDKLGENIDLSPYATKEELEEAIGDIDFSELYTKTETNELLDTKQAKIEAQAPLKLYTKAVTAENKLEYVDGVVTLTSDPYYSVKLNMIPTHNSVKVGGTYGLSTQMQRNILGSYEANSVTEYVTISKDGLVNYTLHPFQFVTGQEIIFPYNYALGYFDEDLIFNAVIKNVNSTTTRDTNNNVVGYYPILMANDANGYQMIDTTTSLKWKCIGCQRLTHTTLPSQMEKILAYSLYCDELAVGNILTVKTYVDYRTASQQVYTDTIELTEEMVSALSKINVALGLCLGVKGSVETYTQAPITDADGNILYGTTKGSVNVDVLELEEVLPDQADNAGKFLTTDGETASWQKIDKYMAGDGIELKQPFENDDYIEVEYIETSGNEYIDTKVLHNPHYSYSVTFNATEANGTPKALFGFYNGTITGSQGNAIRIKKENVTYRLDAVYTDSSANSGKTVNLDTLRLNQWHTVESAVGSIVLDGKKIFEYSPNYNQFPAKIILAGCWVGYSTSPSDSNWGYRAQFIGKISNFNIKSNTGTLTYNFIPVKSKTTDEVGFYDTINGIFAPLTNLAEEKLYSIGEETGIKIENTLLDVALTNKASDSTSLAIGENASSDGAGSVIIGNNATASEQGNVVIGQNANVQGSGSNNTVIGRGAISGEYDSTVIGWGASSYQQYSTAIGYCAITNTNYVDWSEEEAGQSGIAIGTYAGAYGTKTIAIGNFAGAQGTKSIAIGANSLVDSNIHNGIAIGSNAQVYAEGAVQIGEGQNYGSNSLQFQDKTLLYDNGTIPYERLAYYSPSNGQVLTYDEDQDALVWSNGGGGGISEIPVATYDTLGGVIVGEGLRVDSDGVLSAQTDFEYIIGDPYDNATLANEFNSIKIEINDVRDACYDLEGGIDNAHEKIDTNTADLQSQIDNLSAIGQFLAIWDCDTHTARYLTEGYEYQAGNYFIIGSVAEEGGINYMPNGASYPDYVETTEDVKVSDMWFYDGANWIYLANHERAIAVDAELDINSSNPVENRAVTEALDNVNLAVEELQNRPTGVGVPQLASVDVAQINAEEAEERRVNFNDWAGLYSEIVITLNLSKQDILDRMYDLYVTVSRFKTNKNLSYQYDNGGEDASQNYRNIPKFTVLNDLRQKTDKKLYCWRFVTDAYYPKDNPQRYRYFYTQDNYDSVEALREANPSIGLWYNSEDSSGIGTCFNAIGWFNHGFRAEMYYQDYFEEGDIERYEEGDIDSFVNLRDSKFASYNPADYCTKMQCRKYTKDGQNYFFWYNRDEKIIYAYLEDGERVPNGIPKHFDMLSEILKGDISSLEQFGYEFVENRPDLNYRMVNDFDMLLESLEELTFQGRGVGNNKPFEWKCYWFDYPVMPVLLKDCQVRLHEGGEWVKLEEVAKSPWLQESLEDDIPLELKLPYNTYYLWMRFLAIQKRCTYGSPENWMEEEGREISSPMWPNQKNSLMEGIWNGVVRKAGFGARSGYRGATEFAKICEYIEFNLCEAKNVAHSSKSKATPIQKRLWLTGTGKSGLRN